MLDELIGKLSALDYQDHDTLMKIVTDVKLLIRRVFGQESVWMHDIDQIRFSPRGLIADRENYLMTGAWKDGQKLLDQMLLAMRKELLLFGEPTPMPQQITVDWLLKHCPRRYGLRWFHYWPPFLAPV